MNEKMIKCKVCGTEFKYISLECPSCGESYITQAFGEDDEENKDEVFSYKQRQKFIKRGWKEFEKSGTISTEDLEKCYGGLAALINSEEDPFEAWNKYDEWKKENPDAPSLSFYLVYSGRTDEKTLCEEFIPNMKDWKIKSVGDMIIAYDYADVLNSEEKEFELEEPKNKKKLYAAIAAGTAFLLPLAYGVGASLECEDRDFELTPTPRIVRTIPFEGNVSGEIDVTPVDNATFNYGNTTLRVVEPFEGEVEELLNLNPNATYFIDEANGTIFTPKETAEFIGQYIGNETWQMYNPESGEFEDHFIPQEGNITGEIHIGDETILMGEYIGLDMADFAEGLSYAMNEAMVRGQSVDKTPLLTPAVLGIFGGLLAGYHIGNEKYNDIERQRISNRYDAINAIATNANRDRLENLSSKLESESYKQE